MEIYFFHLRNGTDILLDPDGRQLASGEIAGAALAEARAIISADALAGHIDFAQAIEVENSSGDVVHKTAFGDAVGIGHAAAAK